MLAAIEGHKDMVRTLLQHGASVVARDQDGCTALYLAASNGNYEAVKILAQQQLADINIRNKVSVVWVERGGGGGGGGGFADNGRIRGMGKVVRGVRWGGGGGGGVCRQWSD